MHSYLRAIGFSKYTKKSQIETLLKAAVKKPDEQSVLTGFGEESIIEIKKDYGNGIGIIWHGTYVEDNSLDIEYYFPYAHAKYFHKKEDISIKKYIANNSYAGMCEDLRLGVALIFFLQNPIDYMEFVANKGKMKKVNSIAFSALSINGKILLPISKSEQDRIKAKKALEARNNLLLAAKKGDEEAMESLTLEDINTYTDISRRLVSEDVLSIVESSFMPYGLECDLYTIVGDIEDVEMTTNSVTSEEIYILTITTNGMKFNVAINKMDLIGEPLVGRRFKGDIWMQAIVKL